MVDKIPVSEADLASFLEDALGTFGWLWVHQRPARTEKGWRTALSGAKGFPDYVLVRDNVIRAVELKSEKGKLTSDQKEWLSALSKAGVITHIWRPSDWQKIVEVLR